MEADLFLVPPLPPPLLLFGFRLADKSEEVSNEGRAGDDDNVAANSPWGLGPRGEEGTSEKSEGWARGWVWGGAGTSAKVR